MTAVRKEIGDLLVDNGVITQEDLELVQEEHSKTGESIVDILSKKGLANESQLQNTLELEYGVNFVGLCKTKNRPDDGAVNLLPEAFMRANLVVGISHIGDRLTLAMADPSDTSVIADVQTQIPGIHVKPVVCVEDDLIEFLNEFFGKSSDNGNGNGSTTALETKPEIANEPEEAPQPEPAVETISTASTSIETEEVETAEPEIAEITEEAISNAANETLGTAKSESISVAELAERIGQEGSHLQGAGVGSRSKTPTHTRLQAQSVPPENEAQVEKAEEEAVVLLANQILGGAIKRSATHIHIIPGDREATVHYRLNGALVLDRKLPKTIVNSVIDRYKIMAKLPVGERAAVDGHIKVKSSSKEVVCLVSIIPTSVGEYAVVWIV
ncbi:MAG TPA: ATPase, T2SS/T4P/T4SS family [Oculatellaceae cyanobacterium]